MQCDEGDARTRRGDAQEHLRPLQSASRTEVRVPQALSYGKCGKRRKCGSSPCNRKAEFTGNGIGGKCTNTWKVKAETGFKRCRKRRTFSLHKAASCALVHSFATAYRSDIRASASASARGSNTTRVDGADNTVSPTAAHERTSRNTPIPGTDVCPSCHNKCDICRLSMLIAVQRYDFFANSTNIFGEITPLCS